jgi:hypothetical protein
VQIEEEEIGRKANKLDMKALKADKEETSTILTRLREVHSKFVRNRPAEKKGEATKKEKKVSWNASEEKRKDEINEKCKARYIMLSTYEGWSKLKSQILETHASYDFPL